MTTLPDVSIRWSASEDPAPLRDLEWLACNGLGGFASGSVLGIPTRRHHGIFVPNLSEPKGRYIMLTRLDEEIELDGDRIRLSGAEFADGRLECDAHRFLTEFRLAALMPVWTFEIGGRRLQRMLVMPQHQNCVCVHYRLLEGDAIGLRLRPYCAFRRQDADLNYGQDMSFRTISQDGQHELRLGDEGLQLRFGLQPGRGRFIQDEQRSEDVLYRVERDRGYQQHREHLFSPGCLATELSVEHPLSFIATTQGWDMLDLDVQSILQAQEHRVQSLLSIATEAAQEPFSAQLAAAADQFIVLPASRPEEAVLAAVSGEDIRTVIAGYHWFGDWGRDTMISLEGLTLCTGRHREAHAILRTFSHYVRDGLLPNLFPEGERQALYHTVDATLWYFHAIDRYVEVTGDKQILSDLYPLLESIIAHHVRGTHFGIGVDPADGLLRSGEAGYQLTWMDAKVDGWVVTPRRGKPVEIQALWYNALSLMVRWGKALGRPVEDFRARAGTARQSFNDRFWNPATACLFDVVDGEQGDDPSLRPNQVFAISLRHPVLDEARWEPVIRQVQNKLLTPYGLRTLSPDDPNYQRSYHGDLRSRDAAYHQGTVWPWLVGHFIDAWLRVNPDRASARAFLAHMQEHLQSTGVGTISEIFDADPPYLPRGCMAQAWSVAEVLRAWLKTRGASPSSASG